MRAVTENDKEVLEIIQAGYNIALVSTEFEGKDATVIAYVTSDEDGGEIIPMALLLEDDLGIFERLADPEKDL